MTDDDEKKFYDKFAEDVLEQLDRNHKDADVANMLMRLTLGDWYDKTVRKNELYLINSPGFMEAVAKARSRLKLKDVQDNRDFMYEPEYDLEVDRFIKDRGLTDEWNEYIRHYLAYGMPPNERAFYGNGYIKVTGIDEEGLVKVQLKPGLRKEDYVKAWQVLSRYLGPAQKKSKPYTSQELNNQIYEARQLLTYGALAMMFFPKMDKAKAIDRVKKAVKREGQRRKKGGQN